MEMPSYLYGTNRGVLVCHSIAMKFALHERGSAISMTHSRTRIARVPAVRDCTRSSGARTMELFL